MPDLGVLTSIFWKTSSTLRKESSRPPHSWDLEGQPASLPLLLLLHVLFSLSVFKASGLGQKPEGGMVDRPAPGLKALPVWGKKICIRKELMNNPRASCQGQETLGKVAGGVQTLGSRS